MYDESDSYNNKDKSLPFLRELYKEFTLLCNKLKATPNVILSGGDPLLHADFWKLLSLINSKNNTVEFIMGNPDEITERSAKQLYKNGVRYYQMSLEGPSYISDNLRGRGGNFKKTLNAARKLRTNGIKVTIMFTLSWANKDHLFPLMDELANAPIDTFSFTRATILGNAEKNDIGLEKLGPNEYRNILLGYLNKAENIKRAGSKVKWSTKCKLFAPLFEELGFKLPSSFSACHLHSGGVITMLPDGTMYACRRMYFPIGKYPDMSLDKAFGALKNICSVIPSKCLKCSVVNSCVGCRAVGYNLTQGLEKPDIHCWRK